MRITRRKFLKISGLATALYPLSAAAENAFIPVVDYPPSEIINTETPTVCRSCYSNCLMLAETEGKILKKLRGNPSDIFSKGRLCAKGHASIKTLYDPDRLKYPLKRTGKRGVGNWSRISWDEAIDAIALNVENSLKNHGPESIGLFAGNSCSPFINELFSALKIENIVSASTDYCQTNSRAANQSTFGTADISPSREMYSRAKCLVMLGNHLGENININGIDDLSAARSNGAKLIVIDPRMSVLAGKSDIHLMIRPGTDTALLLGLINYVIQKELYNKEFIDNYTVGIDYLAEKTGHYSLEMVAQITDLPVEELHKCAKIITSLAPDVIFSTGRFNAWYGNDFQRLRAVNILNALLSDKNSFKGYLTKRTNFNGTGTGKQDKQTLAEQSPGLTSTSLRKKALEGKIKVLGCLGQNPFNSLPNPYRTNAAFNKADFTFCCDIYPSEPALYADIIIPETVPLERMDNFAVVEDDAQEAVVLSFPVVEPIFEVKDAYWIIKRLSEKLNRGADFPYENIGQRLDSELKNINLTTKRIRENKGIVVFKKMASSQDGLLNFNTPSGKIEFFSKAMLDKGVAPVPEFIPVSLPPNGFLRLLNGRSPVHNGWSVNNPWLSKEIAENELWLNDKIAEILGINQGDRLFLENQDGIRSITPIEVKVTPGIRVDCVFMAHGFGSRSPFLKMAFNKGVADGALMTRDIPNPLTGVRGMRVNFVRLIKDGKSLDMPQLDEPPEMLRHNSRWWFDAFGSYEKGEFRGKYV